MTPPRRFPLRPAAPAAKPWAMTIKMPAAGGGGAQVSIAPLVWRESGDIFGDFCLFDDLLHADISIAAGGQTVAIAAHIVAAGSPVDDPSLPTVTISGDVLTFDPSDSSSGYDSVMVWVEVTGAGSVVFSNPLIAKCNQN